MEVVDSASQSPQTCLTKQICKNHVLGTGSNMVISAGLGVLMNMLSLVTDGMIRFKGTACNLWFYNEWMD